MCFVCFSNSSDWSKNAQWDAAEMLALCAPSRERARQDPEGPRDNFRSHSNAMIAKHVGCWKKEKQALRSANKSYRGFRFASAKWPINLTIAPLRIPRLLTQSDHLSSLVYYCILNLFFSSHSGLLSDKLVNYITRDMRGQVCSQAKCSIRVLGAVIVFRKASLKVFLAITAASFSTDPSCYCRLQSSTQLHGCFSTVLHHQP